MQRPLLWKELLGDRAPVLRSTAAMLTSLTALAATSLIAAPSAVPLSEPCTLRRTQAHHSEGLDTWNSAYPRPTRDLDAVLVFLSFPDAAPLTTPAELTADHFPATSEFFARASYGKFALHPHPRREWLEMPRPSTAYAIRRDWNATHRAAYLRDALATADPHVDFSRYDIVYFVADPHAPGVDSDATKVVNLETPLEIDGTGLRRVVTVFERHPPDRLVLAHETGHVFDLPDLYRRPADGKGDWDTHVGDWDLMGSQFALAPDLFAWHKWKLGWLEPGQVTCVRGAGSTRLTMEAVGAGPGGAYDGEAEAAAGGGGAGAVGGVAPAGIPAPGAGRGTKLAVVRTGPDSALAIEARGAVGNDAAVCTQGVLVYRIRGGTESGSGPVEVVDAHPRTEACWDESVYPPLADAPVTVGESFSVPGDGVRVAVEGRTATGAWTVRITTER
ncbi:MULTISPECIES: M6 family metalloprotease domain-containing protein [Streptomyces]|uniref:M6 family metalloprotease domain-containing protein n=12 Tax=Streptomyces scabiei TaxID=1930 RepID=UPI001B310C5E|nr:MULTISPECIES: M6 family metalloprotease domain-containing protein [Streptomyces]MBP5867517.1 M6 family metalloprotease domain-containing protein [Streptomyces sp. LBUM 1485]MBP5893460.1 M6 family metalloprotease domain-containing protein [Streptomyces sp. LBUM 1481]MDX3213215.1 M6 family metalloprotease domain-containing protein [Streptomyces scabiei]MDX3217934.1 M6 family metalloprotease domain-containing protein [Streptomyces scabiei]MDX3299087.1 M6 family metalloprotease domain-containin